MRTRHHVALAHLEGLLDRHAVRAWLAASPVDATQAPQAPALQVELLAVLDDPSTCDDGRLSTLLATFAGPIEPDEEARMRVDLLCDAIEGGRLGVADGMMRIARVVRASTDELPGDLVDDALALDAALERPAGELLAAVADAESAIQRFIARHGRSVRAAD